MLGKHVIQGLQLNHLQLTNPKNQDPTFLTGSKNRILLNKQRKEVNYGNRQE